jgi:hypothetical protein
MGADHVHICVLRYANAISATCQTVSVDSASPYATVTAIAAPMQTQTAPVYGNLFDGRTLTGWRATGNASIWTVKDGAIVGINDDKKSGSTLYTKAKYEDFDLSLMVMWTGVVDSGVFLRKPELQVQLGQSNSLKIDMTCCFYTGTKTTDYTNAACPGATPSTFSENVGTRFSSTGGP